MPSLNSSLVPMSSETKRELCLVISIRFRSQFGTSFITGSCIDDIFEQPVRYFCHLWTISSVLISSETEGKVCTRIRYLDGSVLVTSPISSLSTSSVLMPSWNTSSVLLQCACLFSQFLYKHDEAFSRPGTQKFGTLIH